MEETLIKTVSFFMVFDGCSECERINSALDLLIVWVDVIKSDPTIAAHTESLKKFFI